MRRFAVLPLIALILASAPVSRAADATVGTGSGASCTELELQSAVDTVNSGGGTITFNCGGATTIVLTEQLRFDTADANYVIDGDNLITLDGLDDTRLIYTASGLNLSLTVRNISLVNGHAKGDGSNERAQNQGGAIYSGYRNDLTIEHVTFDSNRANANFHPDVHGGGAIAVDTTSNVTITDSVFTNNRAPNGGAINNLLSRLTIERTLFEGNDATHPGDDGGGGGAIYNDAGKVTIKDSRFLNNTSTTLGGAIFSWANNVNGNYSGKTVIRNTVIDGNSADHGGGLWKGGYYVLELTNSSVTNNTAAHGGAGISGTGPGPNFKVVNSTIAYNTIPNPSSAAGMFSSGAHSTVKNSTFAYNTVPNDPTSVGAAVHGDVTFTNTIFLGNTGGWNGVRTCFGSIGNGGHNIQYPGGDGGCGGIPVKDALLDLALLPPLGSLAFGQTQTMMPLGGSPALNKGKNCPDFDQRGIARPQGDKCDIGAVEKEGFAPPIPLITAPADGATGVALEPVLNWSGTNTTKYKLSITKTNGDVMFKLTVTDECSLGCSYLKLSGKPLKQGKKYVFIVKAINDFGSTKAKAKFTTATD